jgi:hypothetical protein
MIIPTHFQRVAQWGSLDFASFASRMMLGSNGAGEVEGGVPVLFSVWFATEVAFRSCSEEVRCS